MDHWKLISLVHQCPSLWDRSHDKFRDQSCKANLWNKIGLELNSTGPACREAFKALREKYIREREKVQNYGNNFKTWELLDEMQFLDPYIIARKSSQTWELPQSDDTVLTVKSDPSLDAEEQLKDESEKNATEFCKTLIKLVRESKPVWDRHCKVYHDKQLKDRLWKSIANTLKTDINSCTLRWKGLREKYIRQKQKFSEGVAKWEFLDELSFLDSVILYRKKHWQIEESSNMFATNDNSCTIFQPNSEYELVDEQTNDSTPNQPSSSTNTYQQPMSNNSSCSIETDKLHIADSTLDTSNDTAKKRKLNDVSDSSCNKNNKNESQERTPEQIFGELVAAMLATKTDPEKNIAMMEIMSILAKPPT